MFTTIKWNMLMLPTKWKLMVSSAWLLVGRWPINKYRLWWRKKLSICNHLKPASIALQSSPEVEKQTPQECTERGSKTHNLHSFDGRFGLSWHELKHHASIRIHMDGDLANEAGTRSNSWHFQRIGLGGLEGRGGPHRIHGTSDMFTSMKTIKIDPR